MDKAIESRFVNHLAYNEGYAHGFLEGRKVAIEMITNIETYSPKPLLINCNNNIDCPVKKNEDLFKLIDSILAWWNEHQYDTTGPYGDYNVYSEEPDFVVQAKNILEKSVKE